MGRAGLSRVPPHADHDRDSEPCALSHIALVSADSVSTPLVSALIPTHNRAMLLEAALESIAAQKYRPLEVVIIDDGSTDDTPQVIARATSRFEERGIQVRPCRLDSKSGPAAARNEGLRAAQGSLVAFLDSDDLWHAGFVETLAALLERHSVCGAAFTGITTIDEDGHVTGVRDQGILGDTPEGELATPIDLLAIRFPFVTLATMARRTVLDDVGPFDESLALWSDADLWYRVAKKYDFAYTRTPLTSHRTHSGNITSGRLRGDATWLYYQLRVNLRHLPDVRDVEARKIFVAKIQHAQLMLQEQLLREGRREPELETVLGSNVGRIRRQICARRSCKARTSR